MNEESVEMGESAQMDSAATVYGGYTKCPYCTKPIFSEQLQGPGGKYECGSCHNPIKPEFLEWR